MEEYQIKQRINNLKKLREQIQMLDKNKGESIGFTDVVLADLLELRTGCYSQDSDRKGSN